MTIISDEVRKVDADLVAGRVLVDRGRLPAAIGWELKAQGLCRADRCLPIGDPARLAVDSALDLAAVAGVLGRPVVVDTDARVMAIAWDPESRRSALDALRAPSFTLADLDGVPHRLEEWRGSKKLLLAFSSW